MNQQQQNHRLRTRKEHSVCFLVCVDALHLSQQFLVMSGSFPFFQGLSPSAAVIEQGNWYHGQGKQSRGHFHYFIEWV